jgi:hypothetical protein
LTGTVHEGARQRGDVLLSLAERRQADREDVEAVPEVLAEAPRRDVAGEVPVGRGDDPDVHLQRPVPAHPLEGPVLQHAQELGLQLGASSPTSSRKSVAPSRARSDPSAAR